MKLKQLYSLRKNFTIIGLTGRVGSGCSQIAKLLASEEFISKIDSDLILAEDKLKPENIKYKICADYLKYEGNFKPFHIINYKDVLLLHLLHYGRINGTNINSSIDKIIDVIFQNGEKGEISKKLIYECEENKEENCKEKGFSNRFDKKLDKILIDDIKKYLLSDEKWFKIFDKNDDIKLKDFIKNNREDHYVYKFYFEFFESFSNGFFKLLNSHDIIKKTRLVHDLANNLREYGTVQNLELKIHKKEKTLDNIYIVAETINQLIKLFRCERKEAKIIIDSLKNSLELMYFKEKFGAFYMVASNKSFEERKSHIKERLIKDYNFDEIKAKFILDEIINLGDGEYDGGDVNKGDFSAPDVENCIQKSDYHIYFSDKKLGNKESKSSDSQYEYLSLSRQLTKLIALIHQPGIITPTNIERCMQVAYNAKFNSGCISRQVGAVITDENYSVKSIGWNDVAQNQIPCNLRNVKDLISSNPSEVFSDYEKGDEKDYEITKGKFESFNELMKKDYAEIDKKKKELEGRTCSFCFKTSINAYEGEKNQVHTRSLHAEENAMMQLVKYGTEGVKGGNLFTTASPCELCSKKAFQLGIKNIYYIDPYPGIAGKHILKSGVNKDFNPKVLMYQGSVGRAFHKLYEPFMAYKDELKILTGITPTKKEK
ncbi:hypothetical protein [Flavobacterium sp.]|uniref:hypothetical protein n=1 Tax=Flavobacterium sp. TaxID=239 RepID=UPI0025C24A64|nr:hypothetical protein [Flavobacterium sp.]